MNNAIQSEGLTLVLGATGKTGRRVVQRLSEKGHAVRNGSRQSDPPFDWDDQSIWDAALDGRNASLGNGVQRALGREPRDFADFCRAVAASGVWNAS